MNIKSIIKSSMITIILSAVFLLISALLIYFDTIRESIGNVIVFAGFIIGTFIGAFGCGKVADSKLLLHSLLVGIIMCIILLILSFSLNGHINPTPRTYALFSGIIFSSLAGAIFASKA